MLEEAGNGNWMPAFKLTFRLFECLQKQEEYGWLVDQKHMQACIKQLTRWIALIDRVITPYLPLIVEVNESKKAGEYNFVRKPFLKSGEYSESVNSWRTSIGDFASGNSKIGNLPGGNS